MTSHNPSSLGPVEPPSSKPPTPEMSEAERVLTKHRAAVRANLGNDSRHAAEIARWALDNAGYAHVDVPDEVRRAAGVLDQWAGEVAATLAREEAERAERGFSRLDQQAAIDRAFWRRTAERQRSEDRER
jgi:hypothetical protein